MEDKVNELIESLKPKIKKKETKHGSEYVIKFPGGSSYEFSYSNNAPGADFLSKLIEPFVTEKKKKDDA